jgi:hypothetical protein
LDSKFLVKWVGYPPSFDTWEPRENLPQKALAEFYETLARQAANGTAPTNEPPGAVANGGQVGPAARPTIDKHSNLGLISKGDTVKLMANMDKVADAFKVVGLAWNPLIVKPMLGKQFTVLMVSGGFAVLIALDDAPESTIVESRFPLSVLTKVQAGWHVGKSGGVATFRTERQPAQASNAWLWSLVASMIMTAAVASCAITNRKGFR